MIPTLLREAADRLEQTNIRDWIGKPFADWFCTICQGEDGSHTPTCLISRLREEADRVERPPMPEPVLCPSCKLPLGFNGSGHHMRCKIPEWLG
jgi:hypothetical protein